MDRVGAPTATTSARATGAARGKTQVDLMTRRPATTQARVTGSPSVQGSRNERGDELGIKRVLKEDGVSRVHGQPLRRPRA